MSLSQIKACILVPTYNNQKTLRRVLDGVLNYSVKDDVIVINDGSTDSTAEILKEYGDKIIVLSHSPNVGKGFSLRKGFKEAIARGYENAITIDSDGQHFPEDIQKFIELATENPETLIMGSRNMKQDGVPGKSSFGNKFSNFWFKIETGITLPDTQTGFRLYPLKPLKKIKLFTKKFETEIEVIVKMAWRNVKIIPMDINVLYDPNERVSHFRPFRDFTRISILNTFLVTLTLLYYLPKRITLYIIKKGLFNLIWEEAKKDESSSKKALSIGFGFFIGLLPIWGFQLLVGIPIALLFRMNKVLFIGSANVSLPPMIPFIVFVSYHIGSYFVSDYFLFASVKDVTWQSIYINSTQYIIGGMLLAIIAGLFTFATFYLLFSAVRMVKKKRAPAN
ncbi:MAG: DUF2062 domain-containing protein [Bacteroidia bacterium]|nr:DUF2062 domain-containing protein [Bacteroidia bacterium]